jgi:hypothetical protein
MRSYENYTLGLCVLLLAVAVARSGSISRPIAVVMVLAGLTYWVQGWVGGSEGFSGTEGNTIVLAEVLNVVWMVWLLVVAWRMKYSVPPVASPA